MATRKCGNIYFPKYFMAVRPFFTRIFFQELFGCSLAAISNIIIRQLLTCRVPVNDLGDSRTAKIIPVATKPTMNKMPFHTSTFN